MHKEEIEEVFQYTGLSFKPQEMYLMGGFIGQSVISSKNFKRSVGCVDII